MIKRKFFNSRNSRKSSILNKSKLNAYRDINHKINKYNNCKDLDKRKNYLSNLKNYLSNFIDICKNISIIVGVLTAIIYTLPDKIISPQLYLDYCFDGDYVAEFKAEDLETSFSSTAILNRRNLYYDSKSKQMYYDDSKYNIEEGSSINYKEYYESTHEKIEYEDGTTGYSRSELVTENYNEIYKNPYITLVSDPVSYLIKSDTDISKTGRNERAYRPNGESNIIFQLRNENKWNSTVAKDVKINIKFNSIELDLRNKNIVEINGKKYFDGKWLIKDSLNLEYTFDNDIIPMNVDKDNNNYKTGSEVEYKNDYSANTITLSDIWGWKKTRKSIYNEQISLDLSETTGIISSSKFSRPTIDVTLIYGDKTKSYSIDVEYDSCPCYYKNSTCTNPVINNKTIVEGDYYRTITYENIIDGSDNIFIADIHDNPLHEIIEEYIKLLEEYNKFDEELLRKYNTESKRKLPEYIEEKSKLEKSIQDKYDTLEKKKSNTYAYLMIKGGLLGVKEKMEEDLYNKLITTLEDEKETIGEKFSTSLEEALNYLLEKSGYKE